MQHLAHYLAQTGASLATKLNEKVGDAIVGSHSTTDRDEDQEERRPRRKQDTSERKSRKRREYDDEDYEEDYE